MALKYFLEFVDFQNGFWRIEIDSPTYTDEPIRIEGGENPLKIEYNGNSDDDIFKTHVIPSSATINAINTGIDLDEIFYINDASYKVRVYYGTPEVITLKWQGYLISDGVQEIDSGVPYEVTLKAIDGVEVLDNIPFFWADNYPSINVAGTDSVGRCPMNALRLALYASRNLDNDLPIKWNTSLKNDQYPTSDMIAGLTRINPDGKLSLSKPDATVMWWVDNIMRSSLSWCYQKNGYWYFTNYFDVFANSGNYNGWSITSDTNSPQPATLYNDLELTQILDTDTINENWFWFGKKPFGKVNVLYEDTKFPEQNIVPNGKFTQANSGGILDWLYSFNPDNRASFIVYEHKITDEGDSIDLVFPAIDGQPIEEHATFTFSDSVPIDSDILFRDFRMSFNFMPLNGFNINTSTNTINWDNKPFKIQVMFENESGVKYYLNEFGYWQYLPAVKFLTLTTSSPSSKSVKFEFEGNPIAGNIVNFNMKYSNLGVDTVKQFQYIVTTADEFALSVMIDNIADVILSGLTPNGQWSVTNDATSITLSNTLAGTTVDDGSNVNSQSEGIGIDGYIPITPQGTAIGDVIQIQFQGKGTNNSDILFPKQRGRFKISFRVNEGQRYILNDVKAIVNDAHDLYTVGINNSKNSEESYTMGISSGFSGNMPSSYGDNYSTVDESMYWNIGKTLTELYGRAVMDVRHKPCRVFSGSIDKMVDWGLFSLMGRTYAPLSMSLDCRNLITDIVGVEFNPSDGGYYVNHKSSEGAN